jgi:GxxExxY protein
VIACGVRIHQRLGPGLLESVYEVVLARDLMCRGFQVERQKPITFEFEGILFEDAFRPDLIINEQVIVEVKAVAKLDPVFDRQLLTYLKILKTPDWPPDEFRHAHHETGHSTHSQLRIHPFSVPLCSPCPCVKTMPLNPLIPLSPTPPV